MHDINNLHAIMIEPILFYRDKPNRASWLKVFHRN